MQQTFFLLIRQRYDLFIRKWTKSWENLFLSYVNNKSADQPAHPRSLISAFVVRCLDSNKLLQLNDIHIMHCISNLTVCRYMYVCLILSFTLQERCSVVRGYVYMYVYQHFQTSSPLKPPENLLRNQKTDDLETWYAASGARVLPSLFFFSNEYTRLTLIYFTARSNLVPYAFV